MAVSPARLPAFRGGRPLKRWRYVAAFCDELMLCAAVAAAGPLRSSLVGGLWDRRRGVLAERTRTVGRPVVRFGPGDTAGGVDDGPAASERTIVVGRARARSVPSSSHRTSAPSPSARAAGWRSSPSPSASGGPACSSAEATIVSRSTRSQVGCPGWGSWTAEQE